ncbi:unnamed protein product [Somion occarium]|uniref:Transmembrane protein n=1 Tax=Somion occarium TaxID=3059160 RepID=A0ABP1DTG8_9APHY
MLHGFYPSRHAFSCLFVLVILTSLCGSSKAAPRYPLTGRQTNDTQNRDGTNLSPQVWIPITVVAIIVVAGAILTCSRRGWRIRLSNWTAGAALATGTVIRGSARDGPREFTAEQLAGTTGETTTTGPGANGANTTRSPRRSRRNRRTPSMVSTRSLPVYMKEPGDQELVIFRGPEDMEDASMTVITVPMPLSNDTSLALDSSDSTLREDISTHSPDYDPLPHSPHDQPLLHPDRSPIRRHPSQNSGSRGVTARPSYETLLSSEDGDSAALVHAHPGPPALQDVRGEAPPYFEVVAMDDLDRTMSLTTDQDHQDVSPTADSPDLSRPEPSPPPQQNAGARIRSSILGLFNSRSHTAAVPPLPPPSSSQLSPTQIPGRTSHARSESGPSVMSVATTSEGSRLTHVRSRSRPTTPGHRPSHSGTASMFSVTSSAFRPLSRARSRSQHHLNGQGDLNALNSPSTLSVNSISAPLTHTLVKTAMTYPKAGPTPEQLKLISSRDSFARFGVPYGPDAIAYAASHSRVDLSLGPPPEFEEVARSNHAGPSGLRNEDSPSPESDEEDMPVTERLAEQPSVTVSPSDPASQAAVVDGSSPSQVDEQSAPTQLSEGLPVAPSPTPSVQHPLQTGASPPSAFKDPTSSSTLARAESRASSYLSFATAEESLHSSGDFVHSSPTSNSATPAIPHLTVPGTTPTIVIPHDEDDGAVGVRVESDITSSTTAPLTPRMNSRHIHEDTDMTITPSPESPVTGYAI